MTKTYDIDSRVQDVIFDEMPDLLCNIVPVGILDNMHYTVEELPPSHDPLIMFMSLDHSAYIKKKTYRKAFAAGWELIIEDERYSTYFYFRYEGEDAYMLVFDNSDKSLIGKHIDKDVINKAQADEYLEPEIRGITEL